MRRPLFIILLLFVLYTRLVGINWGLPYPMHPDERNMVNAMQQLRCPVQRSTYNVPRKTLNVPRFDCLNPHFYAYGQLPLYIGFSIIKGYHLVHYGLFDKPISYDEGAIALRIISVVSSLLMIIVLYKIIHFFLWTKRKPQLFEEITALLLLSIVPYAIQFSHFGTTESLLMLLYSYIFYKSLQIFDTKIPFRLIIETALLCGVAIGVKVSSVVFLLLPFFVTIFVLILNSKHKKLQKVLTLCRSLSLFTVFVLVGTIISSPYNFLSFREFLGSMQYESAVALGKINVFYTRPFFASLPYYFQFMNVFPYAFGLLSFLTFMVSFFLLPSKSAKWWLIRIAFLIPFLSSGFMFAKWSRFMAPAFPIMSLVLTLGILLLYRKGYEKFVLKNNTIIYQIIFSLFILCLIIPGIAYVSVYKNTDVRFTASEWIQKNIPNNEKILSETANVVDIPLQVPSETSNGTPNHYNVISFNFYDVDTDTAIQKQLQNNVQTSDYFFVPSRRLFANHTCLLPNGGQTNDSVVSLFSYKATRCLDLLNKYPVLHNYYKNLFDETTYKKIAEITSYPKITLFGKVLLEFPDERSEETWTVFDHPVIRIFKKNSDTL